MCLSGITLAQQQQSVPFSGGGHLTYTATQSSGRCGPNGSYSYQQTNFSNLVYVDWNGAQNTLGSPGTYFNSPGGMGCPPNGPQPSNGVTFTGTTSAAHYSITAVPGATALSATVSYPQCQYYMTGVADQNPHDNPSMTLYTLFGCSGGIFFYTTDGSQATEASQMCGTSGCMFSAPSAAPLSILAALLQSNGEGSVQNAQATPNTNFKTVLASTNAQDGAYWSFYHTPTRQDCTDAVKGTGNDNQYCSQGVQGIPTAINFATSSFPSLHLQGGSTSANLNFATENLQGTWNGSGESSASSPNGTQVLWPIKPSNACHGCTSMVQDFYIWPQHTANVNAAEVQNWELDLEHYDASSSQELEAALQCATNDTSNGKYTGWEYNGQNGNGQGGTKWLPLKRDANNNPLNHDCNLPFGTINGLNGAPLGASDTEFVATPDSSNSSSPVEPGMVVMVDNEEIRCMRVGANNTCTSAVRGYGGTTPAAHSPNAYWMGSVHVQYRATMPGDGNVYIDYLYLNYYPGLGDSGATTKYDFHQIYGQTTVDNINVSNLKVPSAPLNPNWTEGIFSQKQIDVAPVNGSGNKVTQFTVGEFIDQDNVTVGYGVMAASSGMYAQ